MFIATAHGLPFISVIIPTLNEENFILNTLTQLAQQDYPAERFEIIVVDGGSADATGQLVGSFIASARISVRLLNNPERLASAARNLGIQQAQGEYLLFIDAHVFIPGSRLLRDMAHAVVAQGARVLARPQPLAAPGGGKIQAAIAGVRASLLGHSCESHIYSRVEHWVSPMSAGVMYHRALFEQFGLFDEHFDAAEDLEFNYRLERHGLQAYLSPRFTVYYYPRDSLRGLFQQMQRYGLGRVRFLRKHPQRFHPEVLVPCLISLGMLLLPMGLMTDTLRPLLITGLLGMALLVMLLSYPHVRRARPGTLLLTPICLLLIHMGLGYGILRGLSWSSWRSPGTAQKQGKKRTRTQDKEQQPEKEFSEQLRWITLEENGIAVRNLGIGEARGDIVITLDDGSGERLARRATR